MRVPRGVLQLLLALIPNPRARLVVLLVVLGAAAAGALEVVNNTDPPPKPKPPPTGPTVPSEQAAEHSHQDLRDERAGRSSAELAEDLTKSARAAPDTPLRPSVLAGRQAGCVDKPVHQHSSRGGYRPSLIPLHYTVSENVPGWDDVLGVVAWFDNPVSDASSHYVIDHEAHCARLVSEQRKAWTQGAFNPHSACSIEVINTGRESPYAGLEGIRKLGRVVADCAERWGIPLRRGRTEGCVVTRSGVVDHDQLDCGNTHTDIRPFSVRRVIEAARAAREDPADRWRESRWNLEVLTDGERGFAKCLLAKRRIAARNGGWDRVDPRHLREAVECKHGLRRANVRLHEVGLTTERRRARHDEIHRLI